MAKGFTIGLENRELSKIIKQFKDTVNDITDEMDAEFEASVRVMVTDAQNNAPVSNDEVNSTSGLLKGSIGMVRKNPFDYELVAQKDYAPYLEFGTGPYAASYVKSLEPEWEALAKTYFVNGKGHMPARPYMVPAIRREVPILLKKFKNILNG